MRHKESQKAEEFLETYTPPYTPNRLEGMESLHQFFHNSPQISINTLGSPTERSRSSGGAPELVRSSRALFGDGGKTKI